MDTRNTGVMCTCACKHAQQLYICMRLLYKILVIIHFGLYQATVIFTLHYTCNTVMGHVNMRSFCNVYTVNSRYSGHPWDYLKWLEYRDGHIPGYLEMPAAIFKTVSRASSPACKVIDNCRNQLKESI